jgi:hypothetical protein
MAMKRDDNRNIIIKGIKLFFNLDCSNHIEGEIM